MPVNYTLGKIYKLVNSVNNTIYVGSTSQKLLSCRKSTHVSDSKDLKKTTKLYTAMREKGAENFTIVLVKLFPCNSKDELEAEEYRILDEFIASGTPVYNSKIQGKDSDESRQKMSKAKIGKFDGADNPNFSFGALVKQGKYPCWRFYWNVDGTQKSKAFSIGKYGDYGAHWRAEEARRQIYPEWGNSEECLCDDFGEIDMTD
jgi:hypothetical protein